MITYTNTDTESSIRFERIRLAYNQFQQRLSGRAKTIFLAAVVLASTGLVSLGRVGARPLIQDIALWVVVALASLAAIMEGWVYL